MRLVVGTLATIFAQPRHRSTDARLSLLDTHVWTLVATGRHHGGVVVTKDRRIREYVHVQSIW